MGELKDLGTPDEAEVLNVKTVTFTVTRHIRPKKRCAKCSCIVQAPAPLPPDRTQLCGGLAARPGVDVEVRFPSAPCIGNARSSPTRA